MAMFLFYLGVFTLITALLCTIPFFFGYCRIPRLKEIDVAPLPNTPPPMVSVIVPARNEERNIEKALHSLLGQDYENFEILVVDDRSTDGTGEILDSIAEDNPELKVIHLRQLPVGWLGKNYALYYAAKQAAGRFLLFTDADVVMAPATIRKAISYVISNRIDHLSLWPQVQMPSWTLNGFLIFFTMLFHAWVRPWKAKDPASRAYVGIGAFNLIAAEVYRAVGTHQAIAMRPDDDIKLGKIVKRSGYRQEMLSGIGLVSIRWYGSMSELINGLMKNPPAVVNYNPLLMTVSPIPLLVFAFWPIMGVFLTAGLTRLLNVAVVLIYLMLAWITAGLLNIKHSYAIAFPIAALFHIYILWRAAFLVIKNNGISWRDTHYSLADLKANKV